MNPPLHVSRRLLLIISLVLLLHGVVIGAVYHALSAPRLLPTLSVLSVGRIEIVGTVIAPTPADVSDRQTITDSRSSTRFRQATADPSRLPAPAHVVQQAPTLKVPLASEDMVHLQASSQTLPQERFTALPGAGPVEPAPTLATGDTYAAAMRSATAAASPSPPSPASARVAAVESNLQEADYLEPLLVTYPPQSRLRREQGRVVVKVLIGVDGRAQQTEVLTSSGYPRLDQAALASVRAGRFRPAQRGDAAQAAWYQVPVRFDLAP